MKSVRVNLKHHGYRILIGHKVLAQLGARLKRMKLGSDAIIISHAGIARRYGAPIVRSLHRSFLFPTARKVNQPKRPSS